MMNRSARVLGVALSLVFRQCLAAPVAQVYEFIADDDESESARLFRIIGSATLVLLGGIFAGLTIGLMGQDEIFLQVTAETGEADERRHAEKVLKLLAKGKHWVLVTLLLSNVITNETLPIVLDRLLGGGWPAIVSSTAAIVVFGEIIPQSICVRYGLPLGAYFAPFVRVLMYVMYPLAVPIAKLLDHMLGEDHGTVYKRAGLKSFVTLHHHMGIERLNEDEVTIISAVLDLKDKPVSQIMTPINDVFVLSSDTILDEEMVEKILLTGFNRIPIHLPGDPLNFCGMLLVRTLITYDPDDALPVSAFALATLPETSPETSCLNILNYFQEGKSHMVAVSTDPGAVYGAVGVVTLEDVIEELIGEEIIDESDVYVDVHRAIRRVTPSPLVKARRKIEVAVQNAGHYQNPNTSDNNVRASLRPLNPASDPKMTHNAKITIKRSSQPASSQRASSQATVLSPHSQTLASREGTPQSGPHELGVVSGETVSKLARSPGTIVTKVNGDVDVRRSESDAVRRNLGPNGISKTSKYHDESSDDDVHATFRENVINVNGVNKVVIQDISDSDSDDVSYSGSQAGQH